MPTLSADHPQYDPAGGYWLGGVWPPTTYMVLRGLTQHHAHALAHEIACNHVAQVTEVFRSTGTVWENYAPESAAPGNPARRDFVGWSGLGPIAVLFEYVFGLQPDVPQNTLHWHLHLTDEHGVEHYPFGRDGLLTLRCAARAVASDVPQVTATSTVPVLLHLHWPGGQRALPLGGTV